MNISGFKSKILNVLLIGGFLPVILSVMVHVFLSGLSWVDVPLHAVVEALGAFAALSLAGLILLLKKYRKDGAHSIWIFFALVTMGILDGFHASLEPGVSFVWLRSAATLSGGFLFAMIWLPEDITRSSTNNALAGMVVVMAVITGLFSIAFPDALPAMVDREDFTPTAKIINFTGGIFFLAAAVRFIVRYQKNASSEELMFANLCLLFGSAGLLFPFSGLWEADWWFWHMLRLSAYFIILSYVFVVFQRAENELHRVNRALRTLSGCNHVLVRATEESGLLQDVCRLIVEVGGYRSAWVGFSGNHENKCNKAIKQDSASSIALPLNADGRTFGALNIDSAEPDAFDTEEVKLLTEMADDLAYGITALRMRSEHKLAEEKIKKLNENLERRVIERTAQIEAVNRDLEAFSYSVSHDLRAPLRSMEGFSQALLEDYNEKLDSQGKDHLRRVRAAAQQMSKLIDDILEFSRIARTEIKRESADLSALSAVIALELQKTQPQRQVEFVIAPGLVVNGDAALLRVVLENLLGNAWKFTSKHPSARIEFAVSGTEHEVKPVYFIRDNGAGFDMAYRDKLFTAFQRLHSPAEFPGTGIGLATVKRIIEKHGGCIWAEGEVEKGATFYFTL